MYLAKPLVDLRIYTIKPRKMDAFIEVFDRLGMPVQVKYLGAPLGMYVSVVGALNQCVHLWGFDDMGAFEAAHAARNRDPAWPAYLAASGDYIVSQDTQLIRRATTPVLDGLVASGMTMGGGMLK